MERLSDQRLFDDLLALNLEFRRRLLLDDRFYRLLSRQGVVIDQSILIGIFPDSAETWCGRLIDQSGRLVEFDLDLSTREVLQWQEVSGCEPLGKVERRRQRLAAELFRQGLS